MTRRIKSDGVEQVPRGCLRVTVAFWPGPIDDRGRQTWMSDGQVYTMSNRSLGVPSKTRMFKTRAGIGRAVEDALIDAGIILTPSPRERRMVPAVRWRPDPQD